ncbi:MAG: hypothetical protein FGM20_11055 [Burkholderiaceae bacterium]|nr:hypothetical protein [Burkholderiaceae bacterium]
MADRYFNPFQGIDIHVPVQFHDAFGRYSQREAGAVIDQSPFPRMVDLWFMAVCVAARLNLEPEEISRYETRKIIEETFATGETLKDKLNSMQDAGNELREGVISLREKVDANQKRVADQIGG